ncbi:MAG TPA: hypothetical protein VGQ86_01175 [Candidatus Limnocylindria bacterium]|jgi:hypothetical protein|nr:hypothetical protein [Candidatus Limnocylindria bacterium]
MQEPGLPPRPGEPIPGETGKKGGGEQKPVGPAGQPTDNPGEKPGVEKGPIKVPTA